MHVQGGQPQRHLRLQLGREPLLGDVVAALQKQIVQRVQVLLGQACRRHGHERNPEEAAQLVGTGPGRYLWEIRGGK